MSAHQYRIVFRGQVLPGRREEEVRARLMRRLRLSVDQATQVFCGDKVYLKRRLNAERTKTYVKELLYIGLQVRIEREDAPENSESLPSTPSRESRAAAADFDPSQTAMYTPTQLDNVLAGFASDYDSSRPSMSSPTAEKNPPFAKPPVQRHVIKTVHAPHAPHIRTSHVGSHKPVKRVSHGSSTRSPAPPTIIVEPTRRSSKHSHATKKPKRLSLADELAAQQKAAARKSSKVPTGRCLLIAMGVVAGLSVLAWLMSIK